MGACVGFWCYISPGFRSIIMVKYWVTPYFLVLAIGGSVLCGKFLSKMIAKNMLLLEEKKKELSVQLKTTEQMIFDNMDPELRNAIVKKVERDKREEFEALKYHTLGCSERCRCKNDGLQRELDRSKPLIDCFKQFEFCDLCKLHEDAKKKYTCQQGCGRRFFALALPLFENYG